MYAMSDIFRPRNNKLISMKMPRGRPLNAYLSNNCPYTVVRSEPDLNIDPNIFRIRQEFDHSEESDPSSQIDEKFNCRHFFQ